MGAIMRRLNVREVAAGKWPAILPSFGLDDRQLSGQHGPCPMCGGKDRFRFDDKEGRGTWFCSHCGAGDGIKLVMLLKDYDFRTAAQEIEQAAGVVQAGQSSPVRSEAEKLERLRRVWSESLPLAAGDEAIHYLVGRGLSVGTLPDCLRLHPDLPYRDGDQFFGKFPALLARVVRPDGSGATLHRTYLQGGRKAPVPTPRKLMPGKPIAGAAIRLFPVAEWIGVAEGIETALAAAELFKMPVWACVSANGVESFEPPEGVTTVTVFGDNDQNFTGQSAAYAVAHRLAMRGIKSNVCLPPIDGDWLDCLNQRFQPVIAAQDVRLHLSGAAP